MWPLFGRSFRPGGDGPLLGPGPSQHPGPLSGEGGGRFTSLGRAPISQMASSYTFRKAALRTVTPPVTTATGPQENMKAPFKKESEHWRRSPLKHPIGIEIRIPMTQIWFSIIDRRIVSQRRGRGRRPPSCRRSWPRFACPTPTAPRGTS